jgi:hypothetical protein
MTWWVVVLLVALALVGLAIVFPKLAKAYSRGVAMDRCAELEAQLNAMGPGTPAEQRTSIEAQLRACQESIPDADLGELGVRRCALLEQGIVQEWANYKTVSYTDFSQREAKRGAILRGEADLVRCYRQTLDDATTTTSLRKLRTSIIRSLEESEVREHCWGDRAPGCDRINDASEPEGMAKVHQEWSTFRDPLRLLLPEVDAKIARLEAAAAAARAGGAPPGAPLPGLLPGLMIQFAP